jgi:hypothetical protein
MVPLTKNGGDHKGNNMKKIAITTALAAGFVAIVIGSSGNANALHRTRVAVAPHYGYAHTWRVFSPNKRTAARYPRNTARLSYSRVKYR